MHVMLCGIPPFFGDSYNEVMTKVRFSELKFNAPIWDSVSKEAKDLITQMMQKDPKNRPTAAAALSHPWFQLMTNKTEVDQSIQYTL